LDPGAVGEYGIEDGHAPSNAIDYTLALCQQAVEERDVQRRTRGTRRAFLAKRLSGFCAFCVDRRFSTSC